MRAWRRRWSPCRHCSPGSGIPLTATLDDPDGGEKDIEWQWEHQWCCCVTSVDVPGNARPAHRTATSTVPTSDTYTPKINDVGGTLTATVTYADAVASEQTGTVSSLAANGVVQDLSRPKRLCSSRSPRAGRCRRTTQSGADVRH